MGEGKKLTVFKAKDRLDLERTCIKWNLDGPCVVGIKTWGKNYWVTLESGREFVADRDDICWEVKR